MKAARFHGREGIRIDDVPEPQVRPGTVKVAVDWCGICGTDLPDTIALLADDTVDAAPFITKRIGLDDLVDEGFRELIDNKHEHVKILVRP